LVSVSLRSVPFTRLKASCQKVILGGDTYFFYFLEVVVVCTEGGKVFSSLIEPKVNIVVREHEQFGYPPADIDFSFYERILKRLLSELCLPEHAATLWTGSRAKCVDAVDAGFAPD
jgi:hypothetical protein